MDDCKDLIVSQWDRADLKLIDGYLLPVIY